jgi:hypothetical protein
MNLTPEQKARLDIDAALESEAHFKVVPEELFPHHPPGSRPGAGVGAAALDPGSRRENGFRHGQTTWATPPPRPTGSTAPIEQQRTSR